MPLAATTSALSDERQMLAWVCALAGLTRPRLVAIDPTPYKLRLVE